MVNLNNIPVKNRVGRSKIAFHPLGFVAKSKRSISSGLEFEKYFEQAKGTKTLVNPDASVFDTLTLMEGIIKSTAYQTEAITRYLESISSSDEDFLRNLFKFLYTHIQYEQDAQGIEQLREPIRTWKDKKADCDCFSIFISSVLHNYKGGIKHFLRIIRMKGQPSFHHVYVIVPRTNYGKITDRESYWVVDPVIDNFNQEAEFIIEVHDKALSGKPSKNLGSLNGIVQLNHGSNSGIDGIFDIVENTAAQLKVKAKDVATKRVNFVKAEVIALEKSLKNLSVINYDTTNFLPGVIDFESYLIGKANYSKPIVYKQVPNNTVNGWVNFTMNSLLAKGSMPSFAYACVIFKYYWNTESIDKTKFTNANNLVTVWPTLKTLFEQDLFLANQTWELPSVDEPTGGNDNPNPDNPEGGEVPPVDEPTPAEPSSSSSNFKLALGLGAAALLLMVAFSNNNPTNT